MLVTFDFDSTLTKPTEESFPWDSETFWESDPENPNEKTLDILQAFVDEGHRVEIVTTRDHTNSEEVFGFINKHSLPVRDVHFTDGDDKLETLEELGSDMHFDDEIKELERLREAEIKTRLVPHPHDLESNSDKVNQFERAF